MTIRTLLADDHATIRDGLRAMLHMHRDIEVVGDAANGAQAVQLAMQMRPDVVVMDLSMPDMDGSEATRQIVRAVPATRVLVLSMHATSEHIRLALRAGALGYLQKESAGEEVVRGVREVAAGRQFFGQRITQQMIADLGEIPAPTDVPHAHELTERERLLVRLLAAGQTGAEIAKTLELSRRGFEVIRARAMKKLGLADDADLQALAGRL